MVIRVVENNDREQWQRMRQRLWPSPTNEHTAEIAKFFAGDRRLPQEVLIAFDEDGQAIGFAELSIRPYAEKCYSGRVAFLEGWYVEPQMRRQGVGAALMTAAEEWGRAQGCTEMGSDTDLGNDGSATAHQALGFTETGRIICFGKDL